MMIDPRLQVMPLPLWLLLAVISIALHFAAAWLVFLCLRYRQRRL